MISDDQLAAICLRYEGLAERMGGGDPSSVEYAGWAREYAGLAVLAEAARDLRQARLEKRSLMELMGGEDKEMAALAREDLGRLDVEGLEARLEELIERQDEVLEGDKLILEIRAGTGGDEAALFAGDLLRMYQRYAVLRGWRAEVVSLAVGEVGGVKEVIMSVEGVACVSRLKFESGVHRVQRVPATESSGRIHTSAATVAILPEPEAYEVRIDPQDLRIDVFRARGPGGQSVNTTDSAVRVTHLPSGLVVSQQDEKSQHKNKAKALKILRARLYEAERSRREAERALARRGQVGSGDRSQRIRTYNFPQNRVTDHRIGLTVHALEKVLAGDALDLLIEPLMIEYRQRRMGERIEGGVEESGAELVR